MRRAPRLYDPPLLCLGLAALAGALCFGFLDHARNRVVDGAALALREAPSPWPALITGLILALVALAFVGPARARALATAALGMTLVLVSLAAAGAFSARIALTDAAPAARTSLGPGFWIVVSAGLFCAADAMRRAGLPLLARIGAFAALALAALLMARAGAFETLALAKIYEQRRAEFSSALATHLGLVAAGVLAAALASAPLTALALRRPRLRAPVFATLGALQTIPSLALFGALLAPLSALSVRVPALGALGVSGIGAAPALIALTLYSLGPLTRGLVLGFEEVSADVREAARGVGFGGRALFWSVELPLAAPALISALRVAFVQAIGLAAVAALIGAGGLGVFVFEGIGLAAVDLVLLGALPIAGLALAADACFSVALVAARARL